jgi:ribose 1,5-bisphosphate isomerase
MDKFAEICKKIKNMEIRGAEEVAKAAVRALMIKSGENSVKKLVSLRPTEPCLVNAVNFVKSDPKRLGPVALNHFTEADKKIAEYGAKTIEDGMIVFTHCHSTNVMGILKEAKRQGKKFELHNTETRPLLQGRITAKEMASIGIKVKHYVDSAARFALKKADLFFFGADAVTTEGKVINKIGTEMFAEIADKYDIPAYCCTDSWKYDPKTVFGFMEPIESRGAKEVWDKPPKNVEIVNLAFERVDPKLITAIISELGVYSPDLFLDGVKTTYPFLR